MYKRKIQVVRYPSSSSSSGDDVDGEYDQGDDDGAIDRITKQRLSMTRAASSTLKTENTNTLEITATGTANLTVTKETAFGERGELSINEAFAALYEFEGFHDVKLEGSDGIQVSVNRKAVAARSHFFHTLLIGKFSESMDDVVHIGVPGTILKAVVEYLHTDTCHLLKVPMSAGNALDPANVTLLRTILALEEAASYFHLPGLLEKVHLFVKEKLCCVPVVALVILEAAHGEGRPIQAKTLQLAKVPNKTGLFSAAGLLSKGTMEHILQANQTKLNNEEMFDFICTWMKNPLDTLVNPKDQNERKTAAKRLVEKHVHLQKIDPQILSTKVESSGLVNLQQLADAYKMQALEAKKENGFPFKKSRQQMDCHSRSRNPKEPRRHEATSDSASKLGYHSRSRNRKELHYFCKAMSDSESHFS